MNTYKIYKLDVWAGACGEWDRNDYYFCEEIELKSEDLEKYIRKNYISKYARVEFDYFCEYCIDVLRVRDGYPLLEIRIVDRAD